MSHAIAAEPGPPPYVDPRRGAFFLDFDGTLAPIAPRPELAVLTPAVRSTLARLAKAADGAVAVVSGRALASLDARLAPLLLSAAGSHGLERRRADGRVEVCDGGGAAAGAIAAVEAFGRAHDLLVERKPAGAAVHYRGRPELADACRQAVEAAAGGRPDLRIVHGDMIAEFGLAAANKGDAVEAFMAEPPFRGRIPVFAGDDVTDEDGFRAVQAMGGMAIKVGPGATTAAYRAEDIRAFLAWLGGLVDG